MIDIDGIKELIPHRYPFLLVDRVNDYKKDEYIIAYKNITASEEVFQGHFPDYPIYPGVMVIEGLAQTGAMLAFLSLENHTPEMIKDMVVYFMSIDKAKFRNPVRPGDKLEYHVKALKKKGSIWIVEGKAIVDDKVVAEAELKAMISKKRD
ncbi:MAG: 3-hydroxyacyl-ACP dehydratase FabZ [Campylobacterales bacterium]